MIAYRPASRRVLLPLFLLGAILLFGCAGDSGSSDTPAGDTAAAGETIPADASEDTGFAVAPKPIHSVHPDYPEAMLKEGAEGKVTVAVLIDAEGAVKDAQVAKVEGREGFEEAALAAAMQWTFEPATDAGGKAVEARIAIPFEFKLH